MIKVVLIYTAFLFVSIACDGRLSKNLDYKTPASTTVPDLINIYHSFAGADYIVDSIYVEYVNVPESEVDFDAYLVFIGYNIGHDNCKTLYIPMNDIGDYLERYMNGGTTSCNGVNCARCVLKNTILNSAYCNCEKKSTGSREAECNMSTSYNFPQNVNIEKSGLPISSEGYLIVYCNNF